MRSTNKLILTLCAAFATSSLLADPKPNLDQTGLGIQGYDPVAFFTVNQPILGDEKFHSTYHGVTYRFASAEHLQMFQANPAKYEPQFGGYCAYGVAKGALAPVKIDAFQIVDSRLLMQHKPEVRDIFSNNSERNLAAADKNWPNLKGK